MTDPADDPAEAALHEREQLLYAAPVDTLGVLASGVDGEGWAMPMAALGGEGPGAFELAEHARRRAALWTRLAELYPELGEHAALVREQHRQAEARHLTAGAVNLRERDQEPEP